MIVDANDFNVEILGKSSNLEYDDETLAKIIKDNPAGQSKQLTPIILIRKIKKQNYLTFQEDTKISIKTLKKEKCLKKKKS